jgi:hypothetical protein
VSTTCDIQVVFCKWRSYIRPDKCHGGSSFRMFVFSAMRGVMCARYRTAARCMSSNMMAANSTKPCGFLDVDCKHATTALACPKLGRVSSNQQKMPRHQRSLYLVQDRAVFHAGRGAPSDWARVVAPEGHGQYWAHGAGRAASCSLLSPLRALVCPCTLLWHKRLLSYLDNVTYSAGGQNYIMIGRAFTVSTTRNEAPVPVSVNAFFKYPNTRQGTSSAKV